MDFYELAYYLSKSLNRKLLDDELSSLYDYTENQILTLPVIMLFNELIQGGMYYDTNKTFQ